MDIGSVRLTERHLHDDPPTAEQIAAAERGPARRARRRPRRRADRARRRTFVGVSGTVTTVAALALGLDGTTRAAPTTAGSRPRPSGTTADWLLHSTQAERAARAVIQPGRVDVIAAGALILRVLTDEVGAAEVVVSEKDILDGIAWSIVEKG